jgi:hypothetical protein
MAGATLLSPCGESEAVIRRIAAADFVVTESLHGAIIADAFGVPWRAIRVSSRFHHARWRDWADSLAVDLEVDRLLPPWASEAGGGRSPRGRGLVPRVARKARRPWGMQAAARRLRRFAAEGGQLSDRAALRVAQEAYRARLDHAFRAERPATIARR